MLDFNERIETCCDLLDEKVTRYMARAEAAERDGDAIMALRLTSLAQGMNEALMDLRRARVPELLRGITDEMFGPRPILRDVSKKEAM